MTSILRIAEIPVGRSGGMLGVTFAPGKKQVSAYSGTHDRDLHQDLDVVAAWGAAAVVTLVTGRELVELRIPALGDEVRARFMEWHHLPIADYHAPDTAFEAVWPEMSRRLRTLLEAGARVLIHCKGGLGRAGTVAARLLVETGVDPEQAIRDVRAARSPDAIENRAQEDWVRRGSAVHSWAELLPEATRDRAIGALVGLAVGDAVGTTLEFSRKPSKAVVYDMVGGGPFGLRSGQWTDDTAMALALADSLTVHPDLDAHDLMERFVAWYRDGTYSCTGACFDIGVTTAEALRRFEKTGEPFAGSTDPNKAGNGSIMRLAPVAVRHWSDRDTLLRVARDQSRTTHATAEAVQACETLALILADAVAGQSLPELVTGAAGRVKGFRPGQPRDEVRGTGYVASSLHAAMWAVSRTTSFETAVLLAANLGEDADTTAAVAGQIAGALYGLSGIPDRWTGQLAWGPRIQGMAKALFEAGMLTRIA